jgi:hypothetical protein
MSMTQSPASRPLGLAALLALVALAGACGKARPVPDRGDAGAARFKLVSATLAGAPASVTLTVTQGDDTWFPPIVAQLSPPAPDQWTGYATGIPAGLGRQFSVEVRDAGGNLLQVGTAKADVTPAGIAYVFMALQPPVPPTPFVNSAPVLDLLTASSIWVAPGLTVKLTAAAHDPDPLDAVSYRWSATCALDPACFTATGCGGFDDPASAAVIWTAPGVADSCRLSLTVQDTNQASVGAALPVDVSTSAPPL